MIELAPAEAYRAIAATYDDAPNPLIALERRTLLPLLTNLDGSLAADVAAGTGRWTRELQARGMRTVAFDISPEMLRSAPGPVAVADALSLPSPDGTFDLVLCAFALGYAPACFAELIRIVKLGGRLIISDVHPDAIRRGWSRTFRVGGDVIAPAHRPYSLGDLHHPSLTLDALYEPRLGEPERPIFQRAGKASAFVRATEYPAIFVATFTKR